MRHLPFLSLMTLTSLSLFFTLVPSVNATHLQQENNLSSLELSYSSSFRTQDISGNIVDNYDVPVDKQILLTSDVINRHNKTQNFAYIVQIQNSDGVTLSLSWITGTLEPFQSFTTSYSWIPQKPGKYVGAEYLWESVDNPTALQPTSELEIIVNNK